MKSAFDTAQIINGKQQNSISKVHGNNEKNIFETMFISLVRKYELCTIAENSIEELVIAVEFYFLFIHQIYCYSGCADTRIIRETIHIHLAEIIDYIKKNIKNINFDDFNTGLMNRNNYNIETLRDFYIRERHFGYFHTNKVFSLGLIDKNHYRLELAETLNSFIYKDFKYKYDEEFKKIFLLFSKNEETINAIMDEITLNAIFFAQQLSSKISIRNDI